MVLDLGDAVAGGVESLSASGRRVDEFRAAIRGVWPPLEVAELLQVIDKLRCCGQAELRPGGQGGESDALDAKAPEDLQVRSSNVAIPALAGWSEELSAELGK